jgi:3-keto-L-gulonate-6-phosphate decarboxylase
MSIDPSASSVLEHLKTEIVEEIRLIKEAIYLRVHMTNGLTPEERQKNLENPYQLQLVMHDSYDIEMHGYDVGALETSEQILEKINQLLEYEV